MPNEQTQSKPTSSARRGKVVSGFAEAERHWDERRLLEKAHANPTAERRPERFNVPFWLPLALTFVLLVPLSLLAPTAGPLLAVMSATVAAVLLTFGVTRYALGIVQNPDSLVDH